VEEAVSLGARFHMTGKSAPNILFFHGNGEIVADYDELGPLYNQMGLNFLPTDYRGYGRSSGSPSITTMMRDCHIVFDFVKKWLDEKGYGGPLMVMGRSLGSASALELAFHYPEMIDALIIESGFAYDAPLLELLGVNLKSINFSEMSGFQNVEKIKGFNKPTLIIHAELDHIISFSNGKALHEASPATDKTLLMIPGANHNDIFMRGLSEYMAAIGKIAEKVMDQGE
jgi:pimeloyl-ACP methyl ester carboxylesterase